MSLNNNDIHNSIEKVWMVVQYILYVYSRIGNYKLYTIFLNTHTNTIGSETGALISFSGTNCLEFLNT